MRRAARSSTRTLLNLASPTIVAAALSSHCRPAETQAPLRAPAPPASARAVAIAPAPAASAELQGSGVPLPERSSQPVAVASPCTAQSLARSWRAEAGTGFEELSLMPDGSYTSYLHERPFGIGKWTFDGRTLTLQGSDGTTRFERLSCGSALTGLDADEHVEVRLVPIAEP